MTELATIAALLARYDDDAWAALANRGLLRRARRDLESLSPSVGEGGEDDDGAIVVRVGERTVRMPGTGPADATCDCASPVTCQHVIAAGLWLATQGGSTVGEPARDGEELHEELMAVDMDAVVAVATKAGARWAHQMVVDQFASERPPRVARGSYLSITFGPEVVARYPGGGIEGMVLDQKVAHPARWKAAAVLAWQRAHGLVLEPPAAATRAPRPTERGVSREDSRARLRASVVALLEDLCRVGVSHLSPAVHERLVTAGVWAQGADYPRLALHLRRLGDHVDLALGRHVAADDHQLLAEAAVAYGLVCALDAHAARGEEPSHLVGQARASYDAVRSLDLVGLGGLPWRAGSGYQGLTCVFWSPGRRRFHTWSDARPDDLRGFDPRVRWTQPAPWKGLATPSTSAGRRLALTGAQVSADGRISGTGSTSALVTPTDSDELLALLPAVSTWSELGGSRVRSLLSAADRSAAWAVLRPTATAPAVFDPARQTLVWPLLDGRDDVVALELPWSRLHAHAIGRVETLSALPHGALVVARLRHVRGTWSGEPVSVVRPGREIDPVDALHFDGAPRSSLVTRLLGSKVPDRVVDEDDDGAPTTPAALAALRAASQQQAQRGCEGVPAGQVRDRLASAHRTLRDQGWTLFTEPPDVDPAALLLRSLYLVQQVEQALR